MVGIGNFFGLLPKENVLSSIFPSHKSKNLPRFVIKLSWSPLDSWPLFGCVIARFGQKDEISYFFGILPKENVFSSGGFQVRSQRTYQDL